MMKYLVLGLIWVVGALPAQAATYSSGWEAFLMGGLKGLIFASAIWAYRAIKSHRRKKNSRTPSK